MFHPASEDDRDEWLELVNTGTNSVDLSGWRFTSGIRFQIPPGTHLNAGEFLVVAANAESFKARHPNVTNWVAGWTGRLSNSGQKIELRNGGDELVQNLEYADQGDWADRIPGPLDSGHRGWQWFSAADGFGASLERLQPRLSGANGQNWKSSVGTNGTPGAPNSRYTNNIAPLISDVRHSPLVPRTNEPVMITARFTDETTVNRATLYWRVDGTLNFIAEPMLDDGLHGDKSPGDGRFGARIPPLPNKTLVEFFVEASDDEGRRRTWPAPALVAGVSKQDLNALYQVDQAALPDPGQAGTLPLFRLTMTAADRAVLNDINRNVGRSSQSQAQFNATFVACDPRGDTVRYTVGVRNRGNGSSQRQPQSFRVNFRGDDRWKDVASINLNSQYTPVQLLGSALYRKAGLAAAAARAVRVRVNGDTLSDRTGAPTFGFYVANEVIDSDYVKRLFPGDDRGNAYRGIRLSGRGADLHDEGDEPAPYRLNYFKRTNESQDDWSDLIRLCQTIGRPMEATPAWAAAIREVLDVDQWMLYFALEAIVVNRETNLANANNGTGQGDDYFLYFGVLDPRARVIPYDLDTILGLGDSVFDANEGLFRMSANPWLARFVEYPEFTAVYYRTLQRLLDGPLSARELDVFIDEVLGGLGVAPQIQTMKEFAQARRLNLDRMIPRHLSATNSELAFTNGVYWTSRSTLNLAGRADAATTFEVRVDGQPAPYVQWRTRWTAKDIPLTPGRNTVLIQALDAQGQVIEELRLPVIRSGGTSQELSGTLIADRLLLAAEGPHRIVGALTVGAGTTLSLQPGTVLHFAPDARLVIADGGRLLAEGTAQRRIQLTGEPGGKSNWGGLVFEGSSGSPESRLSQVHFEGNATTCIKVSRGTLFLDHATFGTSTHPYLELDGAAFLISHCVFPSATAVFEPVHGTQGIKPGGHGVIRHCYFGSPLGYSDVVDFTGGNREHGQEILHVMHNVFAGSSDDILDLDGTDAWVEGNIFLHAHRNGAPNSSSAVSSGSDRERTSNVTVIGNLFFDCDQAATAKEGSFFTLLNNTMVRVTQDGGEDVDSAVVQVRDISTNGSPTSFARGLYLESNVIVDAKQLVRNADPEKSVVTWNRNILPIEWQGLGVGNVVGDPRLRHVPTVAETQFHSWAEAQVLWDWFSLTPGSIALGFGPDGRDAGGVLPAQLTIEGEPHSLTSATSATLRVGPFHSQTGIPSEPWPHGSGYIGYRWRLNAGEWSAEIPSETPITLQELKPGTYQVEVIGLRDSGRYQTDPIFGEHAVATLSRAWTVDPSIPVLTPSQRVQLSEIQAVGRTGSKDVWDAIELWNPSELPADLSGYRLTTSTNEARRFVFPLGTVMPPGSHLILSGNPLVERPGLYMDLGLSAKGGTVFLLDPRSSVQDSVQFGPQLIGSTIGRVIDSHAARSNPVGTRQIVWRLCEPTFGRANRARSTGDPSRLRLVEWLTDPRARFQNDLVEVQNTHWLPVDMGGLLLSDHPVAFVPGTNDRLAMGHRMAPLSFIPGNGLIVLQADGQTDRGGDHLIFQLDSDSGVLALYDTTSSIGKESAWTIGSLIDFISYGIQYSDTSQGRSQGAVGLRFFADPTFGISNSSTLETVVLNEILNHNQGLREADGSFPDWVELYNPNETAIDLSGMRLSDSMNEPNKFAIPNGTQLAAHGFLRVWCVPDDGVDEREGRPDASLPHLIAPFGLAHLGEPVYLFDRADRSDRIIDQWAGGWLPPDVSIARIPDGTGGWRLGMPTPEQMNIASELGDATDVWINEWMADPGNGNDWFELYNPGDRPVDLSGFYLTDDLSDSRKHRIPAWSYLGARGHSLFQADNQLTKGPNHVGFQLSARGESIGLADPQGTWVDSVTFGPQKPSQSEGRFPDGGPTISIFVRLNTPGLPNQPDFDSDGMSDDWERLHGLSPQDPSDAEADPDGDSVSNAMEYLDGTDPAIATSRLGITLQLEASGDMWLQWRAEAGRAYFFQARTNLIADAWKEIATVNARSVGRHVQVRLGPSQSQQRFFRIAVGWR